MSPSNRNRARLARGAASLAVALAAAAAPALAQQPGDPATLSPASIRGIQHSLIQGGYGVRAADGVWGPDTADALRAFQRVKGLPATGRPDAKTMAALGVGIDGAMAPAPGAAPPRVRTPADLEPSTIRAVQQALARQGLRGGPADGVWGERSRSAVAQFQRTRGLPASGDLDAHTLAALGLLPDATVRTAVRADGPAPGPSALDPAAIRLIQQSLKSRGHEVAIDGQWGERTAEALRAFQRTQGLEPLGEPDVYTLAALGLLPGGLRQVSSR